MTKKSILAKVISNKMNKTCIVKIIKKIKHSVYGKYINRITKLYVHDEYNKCNINDLVEIISCKPISKTKFWKIKYKLNK